MASAETTRPIPRTRRYRAINNVASSIRAPPRRGSKPKAMRMCPSSRRTLRELEREGDEGRQVPSVEPRYAGSAHSAQLMSGEGRGSRSGVARFFRGTRRLSCAASSSGGLPARGSGLAICRRGRRGPPSGRPSGASHRAATFPHEGGRKRDLELVAQLLSCTALLSSQTKMKSEAVSGSVKPMKGDAVAVGGVAEHDLGVSVEDHFVYADRDRRSR